MLYTGQLTVTLDDSVQFVPDGLLAPTIYLKVTTELCATADVIS